MCRIVSVACRLCSVVRVYAHKAIGSGPAPSGARRRSHAKEISPEGAASFLSALCASDGPKCTGGGTRSRTTHSHGRERERATHAQAAVRAHSPL